MRIGGIILAAGMSKRMNDFKPLLPFKDTTIIKHIVSLMKDAGILDILVITGYKSEMIIDHLKNEGVRFLKNEQYAATQMLDSIKLAIKAMEDFDSVLIMPCDVPAISLDTYLKVINTDGQIVRTIYENRPGHPIKIRKDAYSAILNYDKEGGLRGAMENSGLQIADLVVDDGGVWKDVDTFDEYQHLLAWVNNGCNSDALHPIVKVCLATKDVFFGPGVRDLLRYINETGSISDACIKMNMSYSKGVKIIKNIEKQLGIKIVKSKSGGIGGGYSYISEEGKILLSNYQKMLAEVQEDTLRIFQKYFKV